MEIEFSNEDEISFDEQLRNRNAGDVVSVVSDNFTLKELVIVTDERDSLHDTIDVVVLETGVILHVDNNTVTRLVQGKFVVDSIEP